jgi:hypothetical protein
VAGVIADPSTALRQVSGRRLHFAPTEHARQNLLREGVPDERIIERWHVERAVYDQ